MTDLFPMVQPEAVDSSEEIVPVIYRDVAWDHKANCPMFRNGRPVFVEGVDAVVSWAIRALATDRYLYDGYTWSYGCEINNMIGQMWTQEAKEAEAKRYIRDCLLVNPYIQDVADVTVQFDAGHVQISCRLVTQFGETQIEGGVV